MSTATYDDPTIQWDDHICTWDGAVPTPTPTPTPIPTPTPNIGLAPYGSGGGGGGPFRLVHDHKTRTARDMKLDREVSARQSLEEERRRERLDRRMEEEDIDIAVALAVYLLFNRP